MRKILAFILSVAMLASAIAVLSGCGLINVSKGIYFDAIEDENDEIIAYRITGCSKKVKKQDKIELPAEIKGKPVITIGGGAGDGFGGCLATEIIVPEGVTRIVGGFENCPNLKTVKLPDTLVSMMDRVFEGSPNVGFVENGFRYVDGWVVERVESEHYTLRGDTEGVADCISLSGIQDQEGNIHFPEGLRYLGYEALAREVIPGDVTLPKSLKNMDYVVFQEAKIGGTVTLPSTLKEIKATVFYRTQMARLVIECENLTIVEGGFEGVFPNSKIGELVVKSNVIAYDDDTVSDGTYLKGCSIDTLITHAAALSYLHANPNVLEVTGGAVPVGAFKQSEVGTVILDAGVTSVGQGAFAGCVNLKSLTVKNEHLTLGAQAFYQTAIESITAPAGAIAALPTTACTALNVISGTVTADTVKGITNVKDLALGENVTSVATGALSALTALKNATVPAKFVGALPKGTLEKLTVTSGTALAEHALSGATALTEITLPASLVSIGANVFAEAAALKAVHYGGTVSDWSKISFATATANPLCIAKNLYVDNAVVIEAIGLNTVSDYAFAGYKALALVTFSESATKIGTSAFAGCTSLTSLSLPASIFEIGKGAFADCTGITEVTFGDTTGWDRFESADATISNRIAEYYLSDPARAAEVLTDTYADYVWKKV